MIAHTSILLKARGLADYRITTLGIERGRDCARVHAACFDAAWDAADFEQFLRAGATIAHGASPDGAITDAAIDGAEDGLVGIVLSRVALDEAEILTLAVAPAHRRRGLARRLLGAHLESLAAVGVACLFLDVDVANLAARALYATLGFAPVGARKDYYRSAGSRPSAALVLRRDLAQNRHDPVPGATSGM